MNEIKTFLEEEDIWALSITVTSRCNCNCEYCHFYARHDRKICEDITDELFDNYIDVIDKIKREYHAKLQVRFSGGEPLVLGDRMFELAARLYEKTGIEIYVLSNGMLIDETIIQKAERNHIKAFLVSLENPFKKSQGGPETDIILEKIRKYNFGKVKVIPAIMVIDNKSFKDMPKIADYVYEKIGCLPSFAELNFQGLEKISENELEEFSSAMYEIIMKYLHKAPIKMFPYLSPELYIPGVKNYLSELDLENTIGCGNDCNVIQNLYNKLSNSYRKNPCEKKSCEWYGDCRIIKWLWLEEFKESELKSEERHSIYCRMKRVYNETLYRAIIDREGLCNEFVESK